MSLLRSLRAYIGLGPDEEYEDRYLYDLDLRNGEIDLTDDDEYVDVDDFDPDTGAEFDSVVGSDPVVDHEFADPPSKRKSSKRASSERGRSGSDNSDSDSTGPLDVMPDRPTNGSQAASKNEANSAKSGGLKQSGKQAGESTSGGVVRSLDRHRGRPRTITPSSFADSKVLADEFNRGVPIVLDLQGQGRELSRRLIDFASGVCYVLDGSMEKVSPHVFLLTPRSAKVSKQDRRLIEEGGYDR